jgi:hypothetical protein
LPSRNQCSAGLYNPVTCASSKLKFRHSHALHIGSGCPSDSISGTVFSERLKKKAVEYFAAFVTSEGNEILHIKYPGQNLLQ